MINPVIYNPFAKLLFVFLIIIMIYLANVFQLLFLGITISLLFLILQKNILPTLKFSFLGIFIGVYLFMINYQLTSVIVSSFNVGFMAFYKLLLFIQISYLFNETTSNKYKSYVIVYSLKYFKVNQVKFMLYLNFIFEQVNELFSHFKENIIFQRRLLDQKNKIEMWKNDLRLIKPLFVEYFENIDINTTKFIFSGNIQMNKTYKIYKAYSNIKTFHLAIVLLIISSIYLYLGVIV